MEDLTREELLAILKANRSLGPEYDEETARQILDRVRSGSTASTSNQTAVREDRGRRGRRRGRSPVVYFALSIPLLAIAGKDAHSIGVLAVLVLDAVIALGYLGPWNS